MKLVLFQMAGGRDVLPGVLTERGVVSVADSVPSSHTPQATMAGIIDNFETLRAALPYEEGCAGLAIHAYDFYRAMEEQP